MESGRRMYAEAMVVVVLATMWLSLPIMPSSAQSEPDLTCWDKYLNCSEEHINQTSKPGFDITSPSFNASEFFCCPVLQQAAFTTKPCFCALSPFIRENAANATALLKIFTLCNITANDSPDSLGSFCAGSVPSTAGTLKLLNQGTMSSLQSASVRITQHPSNSDSPTGAPKTGAANKIALAGSLFSGILMLFTYFLY